MTFEPSPKIRRGHVPIRKKIHNMTTTTATTQTTVPKIHRHRGLDMRGGGDGGRFGGLKGEADGLRVDLRVFGDCVLGDAIRLEHAQYNHVFFDFGFKICWVK